MYIYMLILPIRSLVKHQTIVKINKFYNWGANLEQVHTKTLLLQRKHFSSIVDLIRPNGH